MISGWDLPSALPGAFGYLYLPALLIVSLASVPWRRWVRGRRTPSTWRGSSDAFALVLFCLAAYMLYRAFGA